MVVFVEKGSKEKLVFDLAPSTEAVHIPTPESTANKLAADFALKLHKGAGSAPAGAVWQQPVDGVVKDGQQGGKPLFCGKAKDLGLGGGKSFTCAAWVKLDRYSGGDSSVFMGVRKGYSPNERVSKRRIMHLTVRSKCYYHGYGWCDLGSPITARVGQYDHVAWRYDSGKQSIVVNGKVTVEAKRAAYDDQDNETIQVGDGWMGRFQGLVRGARIYNRSLHADECIDLARATKPADHDLALQQQLGDPVAACQALQQQQMRPVQVAKQPSAYDLIVSGHSDSPACNGAYSYDGEENGKPKWSKEGFKVFWTGGSWDVVSCSVGGGGKAPAARAPSGVESSAAPAAPAATAEGGTAAWVHSAFGPAPGGAWPEGKRAALNAALEEEEFFSVASVAQMDEDAVAVIIKAAGLKAGSANDFKRAIAALRSASAAGGAAVQGLPSYDEAVRMTMKVRVQTVLGKSVIIEVTPTDTVLSVLRILAEAGLVDGGKSYGLQYGKVVMDLNGTLAEYSVCEGAELTATPSTLGSL
jgi:hypothetical protein